MFLLDFGVQWRVQMSNIIQSLWIGDSLSDMEKLCLSSFVNNKHEVHLYTYSEVTGVPEGVIIKDGREILPEDMIFQYKEHKSYSAFSNYFRYKMLYDKGGYWVDTDQYCLRPFDFKEEYVFSSEEVLPLNHGNQHVNAGVIKAPRGSAVMNYAFEQCMTKDKEKLVWGEIGPKMVKGVVEKFNLYEFVKHFTVFCPIPGCLWHILIDPKVRFNFDENIYGIHLWNEMWRRGDTEKNNTYDKDCLYEKLKVEQLR